MPNETDNTPKEDNIEPDSSGKDITQSSPKRQLSTDSLDEALDSALNGSDKVIDNTASEKDASHMEGPVIGLVNTEPPPLTENSDDDEGDDDIDFFDSEDKKEWVEIVLLIALSLYKLLCLFHWFHLNYYGFFLMHQSC